MSTELIRATGITLRHGRNTILQNVGLALTEGEIVTIVGPNGSGKSTLLRVLVGALTPQEGTVTRKDGLRIGYVPQKLHIDPTMPMTVRRFLDLPIRVGQNAAVDALQTAGVPEVANRQMSDLSGGQFQRWSATNCTS